MRRFIIACLLLSFFTPFFPISVHAQQPPSITVIPSLVSLDLATDKPQAQIIYKNNTNETIELILFASDFTQLEDGYKISFLSKKDEQNYQYSLSSWIDFSNTNIVIEPYQQTEVTVFVDPAKLSPGGHYATVLAQIEAKKDTEKNLQIQGILSSLLFVRTHTGHEVEKGGIQTFFPIHTLFSFPQSMLLRFNNTGDTVLTPYGLITVSDMFGKQVTKGILNEDSLITLPQTIRRYDIPLRKPDAFLFPGFYTATIAIHFGKENISQTQQIRFFSEGSVPLIPILLLIVVFLAGLKFRRKLLTLLPEKRQ